MSYKVLARKYRPADFGEVIGQDHVLQVLKNSIESDSIHQAYLFSGTRGVGKTTIARIFAKSLNCSAYDAPTVEPCGKCSSCKEINSGSSMDFLEIDAASRTGIDHMRELLNSVNITSANFRYKVFLIDEVHMLSEASFNALLKTLEEPPPNVVFLFATTNPDKVLKTVVSRCLQLNLKTVGQELIGNLFKMILKKESVNYDEASIKLLSLSASGSVRDGLTLLDQAIAFGNGTLDESLVNDLLGTFDRSLLLQMVDSIFNNNQTDAFLYLEKLERTSADYDLLLKDLISIFHEISLHQILKNSTDESIIALSTSVDPQLNQLFYEIAVNSFSNLHAHPLPKEAVEMSILRMLAFQPLNDGVTIDTSNLKKKVKETNNKSASESEINISPQPKEDFLEMKDWYKFLDTANISPTSKAYIGNFQFKEFTNSSIELIANEDEILPSKISEELDKHILQHFQKNFKINIIKGNVIDTPNMQEAKNNEKIRKNAKTELENSDAFQNLVKSFGAEIENININNKS